MLTHIQILILYYLDSPRRTSDILKYVKGYTKTKTRSGLNDSLNILLKESLILKETTRLPFKGQPRFVNIYERTHQGRLILGEVLKNYNELFKNL